MKRSRVIAYWVATGLVASSMISGGIAHVLHVPASVDGFVQLGYPLHFVTLLGIWKLLGAVALLAPKFPRLKEWAYAGIAFDLTGAAFSWAAVGASDNVSNAGHVIIPLVGLGLAYASWALRPESRKLPGSPRKLSPVMT
ncbi:MAG: DoxX family protein [Polyangiaceae bacterium]|nr:DoxX family protein [Polyangiaceae bacterium]